MSLFATPTQLPAPQPFVSDTPFLPFALPAELPAPSGAAGGSSSPAISDTDTGSQSVSLGTITPAVSESASGSDSASIVEGLALSDSATGGAEAFTLGIPQPDSAAANESVSFGPIHADDPPDSATGTDSVGVVELISVSDVGIGNLTGTNDYATVVLADGPERYYRLNETTFGGSLADSSANAYPAAAINGHFARVSGATADGDQGMQLAGTGYAQFNNPGPGISAPFTAEILVKGGSTGGLFGTPDPNIAAFRTSLKVSPTQLTLCLTNGVGNSLVASHTTAVSFNDTAWHQVALTVDNATNTWYLYADGVQVDTGGYSPGGGVPVYQPVLLSQPLLIGQESKDGGDPAPTYLTGSIDEFSIYSTRLTSSRIAAHYSAIGVTGGASYYNTVQADAPFAYFRLNDTLHNQLADSSGNSHTAFSSGGLSSVTGLITASTDRAIAFDGTSGQAIADAVSGLAPFSVETWFKTSTATADLVSFTNNLLNAFNTSISRELALDASGYARFLIATPGYGSTPTLTGSTNLADGARHQLVGTLGAAGMYLYVDGALVASSPSTTSVDTSVGFWRLAHDAGVGYLNGTLAHAAVYPTQLTSGQVLQHYQSGIGTPQELVFVQKTPFTHPLGLQILGFHNLANGQGRAQVPAGNGLTVTYTTVGPGHVGLPVTYHIQGPSAAGLLVYYAVASPYQDWRINDIQVPGPDTMTIGLPPATGEDLLGIDAVQGMTTVSWRYSRLRDQDIAQLMARYDTRNPSCTINYLNEFGVWTRKAAMFQPPDWGTRQTVEHTGVQLTFTHIIPD